MPTYIALIRKDTDATYNVTFPDIPACGSAGGTLDHALANAAEALAGHLARVHAESEVAPKPRSIAAIHATMPDDVADAILCPVASQDALTPVASEAVRGFDYDVARRELRIRYKGGADYVYVDVPLAELDALQAAASKGVHVNTVIKPRYRFRKLEV